MPVVFCGPTERGYRGNDRRKIVRSFSEKFIRINRFLYGIVYINLKKKNSEPTEITNLI